MKAPHGRSLLDRVALAVTLAISPPVLPPVLVWLVLAWTSTPRSESVVLILATFASLSVAPAVLLIWMVRSGRSVSMDLEESSHRAVALLTGMAGGLMVAAVSYLILTAARDLLMALFLAFLTTAAALMLINLRYRISLHSASIAGFLSVTLFLAGLGIGSNVSGVPSPAAVGVLCSPAVLLVCWSRVRLRVHSVGQVIAGAAVGLVIPYLTLQAIDVVQPLVQG